MYRRYNPNPEKKAVGDCTVRAMCALFGGGWIDSYDDLAAQGRLMYDMPSSNAVWGTYMFTRGFRKQMVRNTPFHTYTVNEFAEDHPSGAYLLATGTHVVTVIDGDYYDSWDSGNEVPIYYYERR